MLDKGTSAYFWCIFGVLACVNLPFIVVDLVYANNDTSCTYHMVEGISFPLRTWLEVDGYMRLSIVSLFLLVAIISCISIECGARMFICALITVVVYSLFNFAWLIIGAVMFWGTLNNLGTCSPAITGYMFAVLILGFIGVCSNCYTSYSQRNN